LLGSFPVAVTIRVARIQSMDATLRDGITLGIALLGAGLGVINLWRSFDRDRVHIRVTPRGYVTSRGQSGMCIEVINLGFIPVTITQVGFTIGNGDKWFVHRSLLEGLPVRLEPRTAFTAYLAAGEEKDEGFAGVRLAMVKTACGRMFTGNSAALRSYVQAARAAQKESAD
jgi:hypothetical protein